MRKILTIIKKGILLSVVVCLGACTHSTNGNGKIASTDRTLAQFQTIDVSGAMNVLLATNKPQKVTITTDSNLLDDITTTVNNGTLYIAVKKDAYINPSVTPSVTIRVNKLTSIHTTGAVRINVTNLKADKFNLETEGASTVNLRGEVNDLSIITTGAAQVEAVPLEANNAEVSINGSGFVKVNAIKNLKIQIQGAGTVKYAGTPEITQHVLGVGRILKLDQTTN